MIASGDRLFCDTNVFLNAVDRKRLLNAQALHALNTFPNQGVELCISGQVLREFLAVCTRSRDANGLGLGLKQSIENAEAIIERSSILEETRAVTTSLLGLVARGKCIGKQVHDANIVATMVGHGLRKLLTDNLMHMKRFSEIEIVDLSTLLDLSAA